ncbi:uncharacterized protein LOC130366792 isoform X2 [Hyla sarda]|nr:uncharacterized protein LOC130366792 isoform X2 [Hyla sarda]
MVRFLDAKNYEVAPPGEIKAHKTRIMQELTQHLKTTFGTQHSPRQLQKRFSDLKVREKGRLGAFRRKIAKDAGILNERELAQLPRENEDSMPLEGASCLETTPREMSIPDEETIILDLENVQSLENPQLPTCCHDHNFWAQMEQTINRCMEKHITNLRAQIIDDLKHISNHGNKDGKKRIIAVKNDGSNGIVCYW